MKAVRVVLEFRVDDETTDETVNSIIEDALVQVYEAVDRTEDGGEDYVNTYHVSTTRKITSVPTCEGCSEVHHYAPHEVTS